MSQLDREELVHDLCEVKSLQEEKVKSMTDEEVEYYHWLYLEESVYDLM